MINFWQCEPCEHFSELKKIAKSYACSFGMAYRCEQAFSSMKCIIIKNKLKSQLSDSNVKNGVMLSVNDLTPNITDLLKAKQYLVSLKLVMFIFPVHVSLSCIYAKFPHYNCYIDPHYHIHIYIYLCVNEMITCS